MSVNGPWVIAVKVAVTVRFALIVIVAGLAAPVRSPLHPENTEAGPRRGRERDDGAGRVAGGVGIARDRSRSAHVRRQRERRGAAAGRRKRRERVRETVGAVVRPAERGGAGRGQGLRAHGARHAAGGDVDALGLAARGGEGAGVAAADDVHDPGVGRRARDAGRDGVGAARVDVGRRVLRRRLTHARERDRAGRDPVDRALRRDRDGSRSRGAEAAAQEIEELCLDDPCAAAAALGVRLPAGAPCR